ncbi:MAG: DUF4091 domain-containing protein [Clostridia bacterium]|nr:DUF4091 domain-containing protein [Clostridia bacterium]
MYKIKAVSAMEKIMTYDTFDTYASIKALRGLKGERISFQIQIGFFSEGEEKYARQRGFYTLRSPLRPYAHISRVGDIPVALAAYSERSCEDYISKAPGFFPDVLYPLAAKELFYWNCYSPTALMVTIDIPKDMEAGCYPLYFTFTQDNGKKHSLKVEIQIENLAIKENDLLFTQWLHCDSIADFHGAKMMSKKHWKLIENYIKTAARTGITMLLTPLFTPPLDTAIGAERPTMQLIGVKKSGETYTFDFSLLEKWVALCRQYGIQYFELSHLFTQWGVAYCPKILVEIEGKQVKEFGWHTDAMGAAYQNFLSQFLPALTKKLRAMGIAEKCYFHISDEPKSTREGDYENYLAAKNFIKPYIEGFKLIDALSNIEFFENGLIDIPVCKTNGLEPFLEADIKERWCYYCCSQGQEVSNRFLAMPSYRTRILGAQLFLYDMVGFLHWGYNFYYSEHSHYKINPYASADGMMTWPAGDPFSVYPYKDGAIESIRTVIFYQALQDRMLLKMLAEKIGLEEAKKWVHQQAEMTLTFKQYPRNKEFLETLHDKIIDRLIHE